jgi:hypothetical protein
VYVCVCAENDDEVNELGVKGDAIMPVNEASAFCELWLELLGQLQTVRLVRVESHYAYLVFIYNPATKFIVPSIEAAPVFSYFVDWQMLQLSLFDEVFAVACLADAGRASNNDVWILPHDGSKIEQYLHRPTVL